MFLLASNKHTCTECKQFSFTEGAFHVKHSRTANVPLFSIFVSFQVRIKRLHRTGCDAAKERVFVTTHERKRSRAEPVTRRAQIQTRRIIPRPHADAQCACDVLSRPMRRQQRRMREARYVAKMVRSRRSRCVGTRVQLGVPA